MHGFLVLRVQWILIYLYVSVTINLIKIENIFTTREISLLCMWSESQIEKYFSNDCVSCCSQVRLLESSCRAIVEWDLPGPDYFFSLSSGKECHRKRWGEELKIYVMEWLVVFYGIQDERNENIKGIRGFKKLCQWTWNPNISGVGILKYMIWKNSNW